MLCNIFVESNILDIRQSYVSLLQKQVINRTVNTNVSIHTLIPNHSYNK